MSKAERNAKVNGQIILIVLTGKTNRTGVAVPNLVSQDRITTAKQTIFDTYLEHTARRYTAPYWFTLFASMSTRP